MIELALQSLKLKMPQPTDTAIMVIGGAEDKVHGRDILRSFFLRAGGEDARIAIFSLCLS